MSGFLWVKIAVTVTTHGLFTLLTVAYRIRVNPTVHNLFIAGDGVKSLPDTEEE